MTRARRVALASLWGCLALSRCAAASTNGVESLAEQEALRREAVEIHAMRLLEKGETALKEKRHREAIDLLEEALKGIGQRPEQAEALQRMRAGLAAACYARALELLTMRRYEQAAAMARDAESRGHRRAEKLIRKIRKAQAAEQR